MSNKLFSERLNSLLDEIGMPQRLEQRIESFAKFSELPKFKAEALLNGGSIPDEKILSFLASELEVDIPWLLGKTDSKA